MKIWFKSGLKALSITYLILLPILFLSQYWTSHIGDPGPNYIQNMMAATLIGPMIIAIPVAIVTTAISYNKNRA